MPVSILPPNPSSVSAKPRRRMRAADILEALAVGDKREMLPFSMFAKEWECWPQERQAMVADRPESGSHDDLFRIAAVVHALCARDDITVPEWVFDYRSEQPLALAASVVFNGEVWHRSVSESPATCGFHNVWFSYRTLEPLSDAARRIRRVRKKYKP
ncbi:MAG: hypothetical protein OXH61_09815 [Acidimicrobiaceae bacterium]|nr:hypothetical protein [Acidimicrobiaceae bacterium]